MKSYQLQNTIAVYSSILIALFAAANEINITPESMQVMIEKLDIYYLVSTFDKQ